MAATIAIIVICAVLLILGNQMLCTQGFDADWDDRSDKILFIPPVAILVALFIIIFVGLRFIICITLKRSPKL
jgi:hypothetical protein